jgi:tRNA-specific 2-thiouridylase
MADLTAVAMSGGLDSSVTAWLLAESGEEIVGLSMLLWDRSGENTHGRCCGALDLGDARRVANQCGIPFYTVSLEEEFRRHVVDPFVDEYLAGRTPIPCTRCNTWVKFDLFLEKARGLGAARIATGHYARIVDGPDGLELHRARCEDKDQSYYLFELTQEQLAASRFPLGDKSKEEVRELARVAGLIVAEKGESMEICFVAGGIREFVEEEVRTRRDSGAPATGTLGVAAKVVDQSGSVLGAGDPYYRYTVGQRRGLGVATGEKLYVLNVLPEENQVVVGPEEQLFSRGLVGRDLHWIGGNASASEPEVEATVKIRSRHAGVVSTIRPYGDGGTRIEFSEPQRGVAPGQAAVFYDGTRVLGGCWIERALES